MGIFSKGVAQRGLHSAGEAPRDPATGAGREQAPALKQAAEAETDPAAGDRPFALPADPAAGMLDGELRRELKRRTHIAITNKVALLGNDPSAGEIRSLVDGTVAAAVDGGGKELAGLDEAGRRALKESLSSEFTSEFLGLGPLDPLFEIPGCSEIMVNPRGIDPETGECVGHDVYVEVRGVCYEVPEVRFEDWRQVRRIMQRIATRAGRTMDEKHPICDATLFDGSRFNGTLHPVSVDGDSCNIRLFSKSYITLDDMAESGTLTRAMADFLGQAIKARCSILVSGGTGSGKTTTLNALGTMIPEHERLVILEDTPELKLGLTHSHTVRYQTRQANSEGEGEVTMDQNLEAALRKRPDRIIVGECRGKEAYTMLEAMNTGHEGSMTTIHANDPAASLLRLMTLVKQGDPTLSELTIKTKMAQALDLVVQVTRYADGSRRISSVTAVGDHADGHIQCDELFRYDPRSRTHKPCGTQPRAIRAKLATAGCRYDMGWFIDKAAV